MGYFDLPSHWVYIEYEDGELKNVGNTDTLSREEALSFKERWESCSGKKVVMVMLQTNGGRIIKSFDF
jgi:hypothetical protein